LNKDLLEENNKCLKVQEDIVMKAVSLQEESMLFGITYKDVLRWEEKGANALERIKFIQAVQKDKGVEDHNIELLLDDWLAQMYSVAKHWENIVDEPRDRVEE